MKLKSSRTCARCNKTFTQHTLNYYDGRHCSKCFDAVVSTRPNGRYGFKGQSTMFDVMTMFARTRTFAMQNKNTLQRQPNNSSVSLWVPYKKWMLKPFAWYCISNERVMSVMPLNLYDTTMPRGAVTLETLTLSDTERYRIVVMDKANLAKNTECLQL